MVCVVSVWWTAVKGHGEGESEKWRLEREEQGKEKMKKNTES